MKRMKMNKKNAKRLWEGILITLSFLLICIYLICGNIYKAGAEEADPYDWSDYEGEVILDDPEFFMLDEDAEEEADDQENIGEPAADEPTAGTDQPEQPEDNPIEQPTEDPAQTEEPPAPVDLKTMFNVEIKVPADWTNARTKNVRIKITALTGSAWDKVKYRLDTGDWEEIKEKFTMLDGYYYVDLEVTNNAVMTVRLLDVEGNFMDEQKEICIFDRLAPVVTAGFMDKLLHVEAPDDLSGAAGVQVNGLLFTTLENGQLDVRMEDLLLTYPQLAIRAYDYAGNFSEPITLDNPYYVAPTPTPKATKTPNKPTATPAPTATPKATKKPANKPTETENTTKVTKEPAATQEPIVIVVTQEPVVTPEPIIKTEYVPIGPGQPFTGNGNMQTLDVLYSAATNKQFITVQSKKGNTYFLVIDYDKPIDEENEIYETYFLNMVDDRDLLSVLSDEEITATPTPQIIYVTPEPTAVPAVTAEPAPQQEKPVLNSQTGLLLVLILLLGGGGAAYWFLKKKKDTAPKNRMMDESGFEDEDEDESENNNEQGD